MYRHTPSTAQANSTRKRESHVKSRNSMDQEDIVGSFFCHLTLTVSNNWYKAYVRHVILIFQTKLLKTYSVFYLTNPARHRHEHLRVHMLERLWLHSLCETFSYTSENHMHFNCHNFKLTLLKSGYVNVIQTNKSWFLPLHLLVVVFLTFISLVPIKPEVHTLHKT